ncbi:hypothetical protein LVJ83_11620 [Uruburuella testudinis]|uniref:Uncharacterized protein n=1 Tax=Uruburuella testudinis TaxID=1282863 RepID=A0ABY4DRA7_9NEIS|nr:hypothetical protein [Uruburuella testudinis]UOO81565.1 hypothetical protein LVJ83_11620 [Uruburuella testudinis]
MALGILASGAEKPDYSVNRLRLLPAGGMAAAVFPHQFAVIKYFVCGNKKAVANGLVFGLAVFIFIDAGSLALPHRDAVCFDIIGYAVFRVTGAGWVRVKVKSQSKGGCFIGLFWLGPSDTIDKNKPTALARLAIL